MMSGSQSPSGLVFGLIEAEEYGITQANVEQLKTTSTDPVVMRILGTSEDTGKLLGLRQELDGNAIKATATTAKSSSATSVPKHHLRCRAESTICGTKAA